MRVFCSQLSPARFFWSSTVGTPAQPRLETSGTQMGMGGGEDNTTTDLEMAEVLPMPPPMPGTNVAMPWLQGSNPPLPDTQQQLHTQTPSLHTPDSPRVM